jgi:hypothetical protein
MQQAVRRAILVQVGFVGQSAFLRTYLFEAATVLLYRTKKGHPSKLGE